MPPVPQDAQGRAPTCLCGREKHPTSLTRVDVPDEGRDDGVWTKLDDGFIQLELVFDHMVRSSVAVPHHVNVAVAINGVDAALGRPVIYLDTAASRLGSGLDDHSKLGLVTTVPETITALATFSQADPEGWKAVTGVKVTEKLGASGQNERRVRIVFDKLSQKGGDNQFNLPQGSSLWPPASCPTPASMGPA